MIGIIQFKPATTTGVQGAATGPQPHYTIVVDEMDALAKTILEKRSVNPSFFTVGLNKDANEFLKRDNFRHLERMSSIDKWSIHQLFTH